MLVLSVIASLFFKNSKSAAQLGLFVLFIPH
jgi:hypothetical protein